MVAAKPRIGDADPFKMPAPKLCSIANIMSLWATSYAVYQANDDLHEVPLLDICNRPLGPSVSLRDFCLGAMEGTMKIGTKIYNFAGTNPTFHVDCSAFFKHDVGYSRFRETNAAFGEGTDGFELVPYRTVAADPNFLPLNTVLFIPEALGHILPSGNNHDGYFFVADVGGIIKDNHIDVFNGVKDVGFSFVGSSSSRQFEAYVVEDRKVLEFMLRLHQHREAASISECVES